MNLDTSLARLSQQLPLQERQAHLGKAWRDVHRAILWSLVREGRTLHRDEIAGRLEVDEVDACLERLVSDDLVIMAKDGNEVVGAYPVTTEKTTHAIKVMGRDIYAICALDAVSVAPVFNCDTRIDSSCHVTGTPIVIEMQGHDIISTHPSAEIQVGIRWQAPVGHAAHSMCMEIVFLKDVKTAELWRDGDKENISLFTLPAAVEFGTAYFRPLVN